MAKAPLAMGHDDFHGGEGASPSPDNDLIPFMRATGALRNPNERLKNPRHPAARRVKFHETFEQVQKRAERKAATTGLHTVNNIKKQRNNVNTFYFEPAYNDKENEEEFLDVYKNARTAIAVIAIISLVVVIIIACVALFHEVQKKRQMDREEEVYSDERDAAD